MGDVTFREQVAIHEARGLSAAAARAAARLYLSEGFQRNLHARDRLGRFRDMPDLMPDGRVRHRTGGQARPQVAHDVRYNGGATSRPGGTVERSHTDPTQAPPTPYGDEPKVNLNVIDADAGDPEKSPLHNTWDEQGKLRYLQDRRWDVAGDPDKGLDAERVLEDLDRQIKEQAEKVQRMQKTAGGRVFRVPEENITVLRERVEKLNKRAKKLGVPPVGLDVTDDTWERVEKRPGVRLVVPYRFVVLSGKTPKYEGWVFAATLDRTEGKDEKSGIVIRRVPGLGDDDDSHVQALDLDHFRHSPNHCDQCGYNRRRNHTYVVAHEGKGEVKQVGSECIKDFLGGASPDSIAKSAEWLQDLVDTLDGERDEGFGGGSASTARPSTEDYLGHVALMIREGGYKARWTHGQRNYENTADAALSNLWNMARRTTDRKGQPLWEEPTAEDYQAGKDALEFVRQTVVGKTAKSEFEHNLSIYASQAYLGEKGEGFMAFVPEMHKREKEKAVKRAVKEQKAATVKATSQHVGTEGERMKFDRVTVTRVGTYEGNYGTTYPTTMEDEHGNQILWWASRPLELGGIYSFMARIKGHEQDRYTEAAVTQITRPTKVEQVGKVEEADLTALHEAASRDQPVPA